MQTQSLHSVMNTIAAHPDDIRGGETGISVRHDLSEAEPYLGSDPVILDLFKRYLDDKANYHAALVEHGKSDPFTEIAADQMDSSWCALQTRLYELKRNEAAAARAALVRRLDQEQFEKEQARAARRRQEERDLVALRSRERTLEKAEANDSLIFWWAIAWLFLMRFSVRGGALGGGAKPAFAGAVYI